MCGVTFPPLQTHALPVANTERVELPTALLRLRRVEGAASLLSARALDRQAGAGASAAGILAPNVNADRRDHEIALLTPSAPAVVGLTIPAASTQLRPRRA